MKMVVVMVANVMSLEEEDPLPTTEHYVRKVINTGISSKNGIKNEDCITGGIARLVKRKLHPSLSRYRCS